MTVTIDIGPENAQRIEMSGEGVQVHHATTPEIARYLAELANRLPDGTYQILVALAPAGGGA